MSDDSLSQQRMCTNYLYKKRIQSPNQQNSSYAMYDYTIDGSKEFSTEHVDPHREEIRTLMNSLISEYEQLRQNLPEQAAMLYHQYCMKQIDEWEQESSDMIQSLARTSQKLNQLYRCRESDDFSKIEIKELMRKLDELKHMSAKLSALASSEEISTQTISNTPTE
ncbi:hypothetical protein I4U23_015809 [Adineta vaga]|nr:hypothetical protein I4U23_015809 [Adineta vaga]